MNHLRNVIRHELGASLRNLLVITAAIPGGALVLGLLGWIGGVDSFSIWPVFYPAVLIVGALLGSGSFSELHTEGRRVELLLRPTPEWTLVLVRAVGKMLLMVAMMVATFSVASILGAALHALLANAEVIAFFDGSIYAAAAWTSGAYWLFIGLFLINAVFTLGSVYFRKSPLFRTLLLGAGWGMSYAIVSVIAARVVFGRYITQDNDSVEITLEGDFEQLFPLLSQNIELYAALGAIVAAIGFYALAILRLRETEA